MRRLATALVFLGLAGACRTAEPERRPEGVVLSKPKPVRSEPFMEEGVAAPAELSGFTFAGAVSCLPLAAGRTCLALKDDLAPACAKVQGKVLSCESCQQLCDKPVAR